MHLPTTPYTVAHYSNASRHLRRRLNSAMTVSCNGRLVAALLISVSLSSAHRLNFFYLPGTPAISQIATAACCV